MKNTNNSSNFGAQVCPVFVQQRGIALVIALVLLVVATLTGIYAMQGVSLQARMAGNMHDRSLSMQKTESALRAGVQQVKDDDCDAKKAHRRCSVAVATCSPLPATWVDVPAAFVVNANISPDIAQYQVQFAGVNEPDKASGKFNFDFRVFGRSQDKVIEGRSFVELDALVGCESNWE